MAYHPQADGQSERTNQTVETALRCLLVGQPGSWNWEELLPEVEYALNTSTNTTTNETPCKLLYGIEPRDEISTADHIHKEAKNFICSRQLQRQEVEDAIRYAQAQMALYYDRKHQPMELTGAVYLRLSKPTSIGYKLADTNKLSIVKDGPFKIKQWSSPSPTSSRQPKIHITGASSHWDR